jgi:hypothetical protein
VWFSRIVRVSLRRSDILLRQSVSGFLFNECGDAPDPGLLQGPGSRNHPSLTDQQEYGETMNFLGYFTGPSGRRYCMIHEGELRFFSSPGYLR